MMGCVLREFLERGANPNIRFAIRRHHEHSPRRMSKDESHNESSGYASDEPEDVTNDSTEVAPASRDHSGDESGVMLTHGLSSEKHSKDDKLNLEESPNLAPRNGESLRTGSSRSPSPPHTLTSFEIHIGQADGNIKRVRVTKTYLAPPNQRFLDLVDAHGGELSFAEFIDYGDFDNKQALLEILERKSCHGDSVAAMDQSEGEKSNVPRWATDHEHPQQQPGLSAQPVALPSVTPTETAVGVDRSYANRSRRWHEMMLGNPLIIFLTGECNKFHLRSRADVDGNFRYGSGGGGGSSAGHMVNMTSGPDMGLQDSIIPGSRFCSY